MKKRAIILIIILLATIGGTCGLSANPIQPAADTTVSAEYLRKIEQDNQRMNDSIAALNMERRINEIVEEKAKSKMDADIMLFGTIFTALTAIVGIVVPYFNNRSWRKKMAETVGKTKQAVAEAQKSANEAKALTYFMQALKEEDLDLQIDRYTSAIEINPEYASAYNNRGITYRKKDDYDNAIKDFTKAIEINPNHAEAYNNRGNAYRKKDDYDNAIKDFTKAIEKKKDYAYAYNNRGLAYFDNGEYTKAIKDYDKAIEIKPDYAKAYNNRGKANKGLAEKLEAEGKTDEALALYKAAVKDFDEALKRTQDDNVRGNAILLKQLCEEAIKRLEGGDEVAEAVPQPRK